MNGPAPLLEARGLRVEHRDRRGGRVIAVRDVGFDLMPGRILGIVGESGCGKTSLVRVLLGLEPPAAGSVIFRGQDLAGLRGSAARAARRGMGHVFQDPANSLSPRRSVRQSLEEPLRLYRIGDRVERSRRVMAALETVGLGNDLLARFPHELSGGQRQRIALARALVAEPALIVADEPMAALDVSAQARIVELIRRVRDDTGIAFLLVAHDLAVVRQLADVVGVMYLGRLVESAPASQVFRSPAHPYTQALISAARGTPSPDGGRATLGGQPPSPLTPPPGCVFHTRCPRVFDRCSRDDPAPVELPGDEHDPLTHTVRCHLWS